MAEELAIVRGIPLEEEPGLGALTLPGFLRQVVDRYGPREALVEHREDGTPERWTYDDLWDRSVAVARALIACGVGKDERVGILMTNRLEWVSAFFGIGLAGGTAVGLSTFSTPAELEFLIKASGMSVVMFEGRVLAKDFAAILTELEPAITSAAPGSWLRPSSRSYGGWPWSMPVGPAARSKAGTRSWRTVLRSRLNWSMPAPRR